MSLNRYQAPHPSTLNTQYFRQNYPVKIIIDKACGCWPRILESLGINASYLKNKHGACPICGGKDRFRFDDKQRGTFFCNKCGPGDGIKLLQLYHNCRFVEVLDMIVHVLGIKMEDSCSSSSIHISHYVDRVIEGNRLSQPDQNNIDKRRNYLNKTWGQATLLTTGDPVDCYLRSRGIQLDSFPSILRCHPQLPYYDNDGVLIGRHPAMLAMVQDKDNYAITLHRTYLGVGCKANVEKPKKLMSAITPGASIGAAIKLHQPVDGKLALAEGIETALAFSVATQLPVWATVSAGGMEKVCLPQSAVFITIAIDNDVSERGMKAANILSKRLISEGRHVKRVMPPIVGHDFADMLMEKC